VTPRNQRNAIIALPKTVKAELLQLTLYALATYPLAHALITKMVTGKLPSDPKFQQEWRCRLVLFPNPSRIAAEHHADPGAARWT
jgi:hypothetical protein